MGLFRAGAVLYDRGDIVVEVTRAWACRSDSPAAAGEARTRRTGRGAKLVDAYCLFRSDTKAQLLACQTRVDADQVRARNDPAARWARRELHGCPAVASDLCGDLFREDWETTIEREAR